MTKHKMTLMTVCLLTAVVVARAAEPLPPGNEPVEKVNIFYFGNSYSGSTMPSFHEELGKSAGKTWTHDKFFGPGCQLWGHRKPFMTGGVLVPAPEEQGWTLNESQDSVKGVGFGEWSVNQFLKGDWDAIMLQPFADRKIRDEVVTEMWGGKFPEPTDISDSAAGSDLINIFLGKNPQGSVFVYMNWGAIAEKYHEFKRTVLGTKDKRGELRYEQIEPLRHSVDYETQWMKDYYPDDDLAMSGRFNTRDHKHKLFEAFKEKNPELWEDGRLRMIPAADVFHLLDRKIRAGIMPGVYSIGEFSADLGHARGGLPAYTLAATFFSVIFREHPDKLDWTIYNQQSKYEDPYRDHGVILEITPERAKLVNDTIWEIVQALPQCRLNPDADMDDFYALFKKYPAVRGPRVFNIGGIQMLSAMPHWHPGLMRKTGREMNNNNNYVLGQRNWELRNAERFFSDNPLYMRQKALVKLESEPWDAMCLQPTGSALDEEVAVSAQFIDKMRKLNPDIRFMLFESWPTLAAAAEARKELKLKQEDIIPEEKMSALRRSFDYAEAWNASADASSKAGGVNAAYLESYRGKLAEKYPELVKAGGLIRVPAGELLLALGKLAEEGKIPGAKSAADFYKDESTLRTGLPRYAVAALYLASFFGEVPGDLDWELFNDARAYLPDTANAPMKDTPPDPRINGVKPEKLYGWFDMGPHFEMSEDTVAVVNNTINRLVNQTGTVQ